MKLKIGKIPYANLFPIFHLLKRDCDCSGYEFVEDMPSRLNKMLREGMVDVSPSSSIEYLRNPSLYNIINGHSISSSGPIGSILLFSDRPLEKMDGAGIHVTFQSETSVGLLAVILKKFYGHNCTLTISDRPESCLLPFLLIGDDALQYNKGHGQNKPGAPCRYVYDLGRIWYEKTGLPFVFALWIFRKDCPDKGLLERLEKDLDRVQYAALKDFPNIASHAPIRSFMTEGEIVGYWQKIQYGLEERHIRGLELFGRLLEECGLF